MKFFQKGYLTFNDLWVGAELVLDVSYLTSDRAYELFEAGLNLNDMIGAGLHQMRIIMKECFFIGEDGSANPNLYRGYMQKSLETLQRMGDARLEDGLVMHHHNGAAVIEIAGDNVDVADEA